MGLRGGVVAAPSLEKPESKTPPRHFEGGYRPVLTLSLSPPPPLPPLLRSLSTSLHLLLLLYFPLGLHPAFMVLISPRAMQATRASTTVSVFADCSIPAGLRIGPVPGIFKLGKYVSDRKEVGAKKKVGSLPLLKLKL